jgi:hypothetical protein
MFEEKPTPVPETPATPPMGNEMLPNSFKEFVRKATLGSARKLGDKTAKVRQQRELLKRKEVISALQDIVAIGKIAEEVGLTAIRMTALQLRGALALVVQQAQDEEGLANCAAAGQAWIEARRPVRELGKFTVFVSATTVGPELTEAGKTLQLRRVSAPRGLRGKLDLVAAIDLGQRFSATVQLFDGDAEYIIVKQGVVDRDLVSLLEAEFGVSSGTSDKVIEVTAVDAVVIDPAAAQIGESPEPADDGLEVPTDPNIETPPPRHTVRPTLQRRPGNAA